MNRFKIFIRRPVKRSGATQHLLITLLSFAASVTFTRLILTMTGYPKLGSGQIHIAHVLWGGLLLFIASLLPMILANRWVYLVDAILSGVGVGLFIDEVGKFITANNNYFYPLAAPIIYAFFLITVLLYLGIRRPPPNEPRVELYYAFDMMEEVLEHDLDRVEMAELETRLKLVAEQNTYPDLARLAKQLLDFLYSDALKLTEERPGLWQRWLPKWQKFEAAWVTRVRMKAVLAGGLLALGLVGLTNMALSLPIGNHPVLLERTLTQLIIQGQISSEGGLDWFLARLVLEASVGMMLLVSAGLMIANRDRMGIFFGYISLLLSLTTVDLLVFYFDQFSAIITASVQLALLTGVAYYRRRYLLTPDKIRQDMAGYEH